MSVNANNYNLQNVEGQGLLPVPSPRGEFGGLSPPNKAPSPQIEIWNTIS